MNMRRGRRKFFDKIIHLLGGYTMSEYTSLDHRYHKIMNEASDEQAIQICNETTYKNLKSLLECMDSMYGWEPEIWCDRIYNIVKNNCMRVLSVHLMNNNSHKICRVNTELYNTEELRDAVMADLNEEKENAKVD